MNFTQKQIEDAVKAKGYVWFDDKSNKGYDVNIVGVRNNNPSMYQSTWGEILLHQTSNLIL